MWVQYDIWVIFEWNMAEKRMIKKIKLLIYLDRQKKENNDILFKYNHHKNIVWSTLAFSCCYFIVDYGFFPFCCSSHLMCHIDFCFNYFALKI